MAQKKIPGKRDTKEERSALQQVRRLTRLKTVPSGKIYKRKSRSNVQY